ncbi:hypothetical protein [Variovorax sp. dw_954]|uniref:hypothetical protein n=1 Tax=Variovorax sp. dw_954 TaxID=2720078 RepID=UPI001BD4F01D|nr:hypothetical protein [Variovorax sp. dw_954]
MNAFAVNFASRLRLEDLGAEIAHARRHDDLGRLAALCFCEVRSWATGAGEQRLADLAWSLCIRAPAANRIAFLARIDRLIAELEEACMRAGIDSLAATLRVSRRQHPSLAIA